MGFSLVETGFSLSLHFWGLRIILSSGCLGLSGLDFWLIIFLVAYSDYFSDHSCGFHSLDVVAEREPL